jgi:hypothetical protein
MVIGWVEQARDRAAGWLYLMVVMPLVGVLGRCTRLCIRLLRRYTYRGRHRSTTPQLWDLDRASAGGW